MKKIKYVTGLLCIFLWLLPIKSFAYNLATAQPSQLPNPSTVTANQNTTVTINWMINLDTFNSICPCSISSSSGQYSVGSLATPVLPTLNHALTPASQVIITEVIIIPASVTMDAYLAGQGLSYTRTFTSFEGVNQGNSLSFTASFTVDPPPAPNLNVSPSISSYLVDSNGIITANWSFSQLVAGVSVSSANGLFTSAPTPNATLGNSGTALTLPANAFSVSEQIQLPSSILALAEQNNLTSIYYSRSFNAGASGDTARSYIRINLVERSSSPQAQLDIKRIALSFNDRSISKIIKSGDRTYAVAEIKYVGTGLLSAMWEIADPSSTRGGQSIDRLIYLPMRSVRQYLGVGGRVTLQSPVLPANLQGNYILRLRVFQPLSLNFAQPVLRYSVNQNSGVSGLFQQNRLQITAPRDNAVLLPGLQFLWKAVDGAKAYQLELYLFDINERLSSELNQKSYDDSTIAKKTVASGLLVPGETTSVRLSALSREQLLRGESYLWRILAIGKEGKVISRSSVRQIRVP